jgi:hypothetical protein
LFIALFTGLFCRFSSGQILSILVIMRYITYVSKVFATATIHVSELRNQNFFRKKISFASCAASTKIFASRAPNLIKLCSYISIEGRVGEFLPTWRLFIWAGFFKLQKWHNFGLLFPR